MINQNINLQAVRGGAVLAVVFYHFFPGKFSLGFLGVDIFFILSGFFISKILNFNVISLNSCLNFLFSRFLRLAPLLFILYGFVFFVIFVDNKLPGLMVSDIFSDIYFSLLGLLNLKYIGIDNYFSESKYERPLMMLWSLMLEIHFYLFIGISHLSTRRRLVVYLSFILSLIVFFIQYLYESSSLFYNSFARYWEFLLGYFVFELSRYLNKFNKNIWYLILPIIANSLILFAWDPFAFQPQILLIPFMFCNAVLILFILDCKFYYFRIINFFVFFGDISYSLYLFHWPVISFFFLFYFSMPDLIYRIFFLLFSVIFAYASTLCIDMPIRNFFKRK